MNQHALMWRLSGIMAPALMFYVYVGYHWGAVALLPSYVDGIQFVQPCVLCFPGIVADVNKLRHYPPLMVSSIYWRQLESMGLRSRNSFHRLECCIREADGDA